MCTDEGNDQGHDSTHAAPREAAGEAVDPIALEAGGFEVEPTVAVLAATEPDLVVPAHATGWRAQHRPAATLPGPFVPKAVGTSFHVAA